MTLSIVGRILEALGLERPQPPASVNVAAIMDGKAREYEAQHGQRLDWRQSLEDTMKALGLGDSPHDRIELARDLDCPQSLVPGGAAANEWTRKALLRTLEAHGGKVPDGLL